MKVVTCMGLVEVRRPSRAVWLECSLAVLTQVLPLSPGVLWFYADPVGRAKASSCPSRESWKSTDADLTATSSSM